MADDGKPFQPDSLRTRDNRKNAAYHGAVCGRARKTNGSICRNSFRRLKHRYRFIRDMPQKCGNVLPQIGGLIPVRLTESGIVKHGLIRIVSIIGLVSAQRGGDARPLSSFNSKHPMIRCVFLLAIGIGSWCQGAEPASTTADGVTSECLQLRDSLQRIHGKRPAFAPSAEADAVAHGEHQLALVLRERPPLVLHLKTPSPLRSRLISMFRTKEGHKIHWSNTTPDVQTNEPHARTDFAKSGEARVSVALSRNQVPLTHDELLSALVFELHNAGMNAPNWKRINARAEAKEISRDEYVRRIAAHEFDAITATRFFYAYDFLPWAQLHKIETKANNWWCAEVNSVDDHLAKYVDRSAYPWVPYGRQYDRIMAGRDLVETRYDDALQKYEELLKTEPSVEVALSDSINAAYCCSNLSLHDKALQHLRKATTSAVGKRDKAELHYRIAIEQGCLIDFAAARQSFLHSIAAEPGGPYHAMSLQRRISLEQAAEDEVALKRSYEEYQKHFPRDPYLKTIQAMIESAEAIRKSEK